MAGWNWFRPLPTTKGVSVFLSVSRFGLGCGSVEWPFPVRFSLYIHFLFLIFSSSSTTSSPRLKGRRPPAISSWRLSAAVCRVLPLSITSGHRFLRFCYKRAQSGGWFFFLFFSLNLFFCRNSWRKKGENERRNAKGNGGHERRTMTVGRAPHSGLPLLRIRCWRVPNPINGSVVKCAQSMMPQNGWSASDFPCLVFALRQQRVASSSSSFCFCFSFLFIRATATTINNDHVRS